MERKKQIEKMPAVFTETKDRPRFSVLISKKLVLWAENQYFLTLFNDPNIPINNSSDRHKLIKRLWFKEKPLAENTVRANLSTRLRAHVGVFILERFYGLSGLKKIEEFLKPPSNPIDKESKPKDVFDYRKVFERQYYERILDEKVENIWKDKYIDIQRVIRNEEKFLFSLNILEETTNDFSENINQRSTVISSLLNNVKHVEEAFIGCSDARLSPPVGIYSIESAGNVSQKLPKNIKRAQLHGHLDDHDNRETFACGGCGGHAQMEVANSFVGLFTKHNFTIPVLEFIKNHVKGKSGREGGKSSRPNAESQAILLLKQNPDLEEVVIWIDNHKDNNSRKFGTYKKDSSGRLYFIKDNSTIIGMPHQGIKEAQNPDVIALYTAGVSPEELLGVEDYPAGKVFGVGILFDSKNQVQNPDVVMGSLGYTTASMVSNHGFDNTRHIALMLENEEQFEAMQEMFKMKKYRGIIKQLNSLSKNGDKNRDLQITAHILGSDKPKHFVLDIDPK